MKFQIIRWLKRHNPFGKRVPEVDVFLKQYRVTNAQGTEVLPHQLRPRLFRKSPLVLGSPGRGMMYHKFVDAVGNELWEPRDWIYYYDAQGQKRRRRRKWNVYNDEQGQQQWEPIWEPGAVAPPGPFDPELDIVD